jgi:Domain of unknown function (DUF3854)
VILSDRHRRMLVEDSAISEQVIRERGTYSEEVKARLADLGFTRSQQRTPACVFPLHNVVGRPAGHIIRPDNPRVKDGREIRYELARGGRMVLDVPPRVRDQVQDVHVPLIVTEGVKKADAGVSAGLCCIALLSVWAFLGTRGGGGRAVLEEFREIPLDGREIVIAYDSDVMLKVEVRDALSALALVLDRRGARVQYLYLPSENGRKCGLDDYFAQGHTAADVLALVSDRPPPRPLPRATEEDPRPALVPPGDLQQVSAAAWEAIRGWLSLEEPERFVARFGSTLAWLERGEEGRLVARPIDRPRAMRLLAEAGRWGRPSRDGCDPTPPPRVVADNLLVDPACPLPTLERITEVPTLTADGALHDQPGYHRRSRCFYAPATGLRRMEVPAEPGKRAQRMARALICDELLADFPFATEADRAHAVALGLQPFVRPLIRGPTPIFVVESPTPGSGKGLLVKAALWPALGPVRALAPRTREEEWAKTLTAKLRTAPGVCWFDNVRHRIDSPALAAAVTEQVEDRLLGVSELISLPVSCAWVISGNNPRLSDEIVRRSVRIRLDADVEFPERRSGFRHPDLLGWVAEHRGKLVWSALVLARAWIAAGRPAGKSPTMGGFEAWAAVMSGMLDLADLPGLLSNADELREADEDTSMLEFLRDVQQEWHGHQFSARDVLRIAEEHLYFPERVNRVQHVGTRLRDVRDRPRMGIVVRAVRQSGGSTRWRIEQVQR